MSPEFLLTAFIVCVAPGIGVVHTLSVALGGGTRAGLLAAVGCTLCTAIHLGLAIAGLAAALHASAFLFQAIKLAGVAYLLWMAWATLRGGGALDIRRARTRPAARVVWRGFLLNILNPKLPLFFVAMTFATFALYAVAAGWMRSAVIENPAAMHWLRRAFAASFAGLGARLALERT